MTYPLFDPENPSVRLIWDNTSVSALMRDPEAYYYQYVEGWSKKSPILSWGQIYHAALEERDRAKYEGMGLTGQIARALEKCYELEAELVPGDSSRTLETLCRAVEQYCREYEKEDVVPMLVGGRPCFELNFRLPLPIKGPSGLNYIYCGYMDGFKYVGGEPMVWERKHTGGKMDGRYWKQFEDSTQLLGYGFTCKAMFPDLKVKGTVIDACQTLVNESRFDRKSFGFNSGMIEQHFEDVQQWIKVAESFALSGRWPRRRQSFQLDGTWKSVLDVASEMRKNYISLHFDRLPLWNPSEER